MKKCKDDKEVIAICKSHEEALACSLDLVEEMLDDLEKALGMAVNSAVLNEIKRVRGILCEIKANLRLKSHRATASGIFISRCAKIWETLCDLKSDRLRKYGEPSRNLAEYLDPKIDEMIKSVNKILDIARG